MLSLVVLLPILAACGGGDEETIIPEETATPSATLTQTTSPTLTIIPTATPNSSNEPVKIGIIQAWSGPMALSGILSDSVSNLMEWYVQKQGGILGGRLVKFIKYDNRGTVADSGAGATKLVKEDHVTAITEGGASDETFFAVANVTDPLKVPFIHFGTVNALLSNYKWTATTISIENERADEFSNFILNTLKPKTIGILAQEMADGRVIWDLMKPKLNAAGVNIVYEDFVQPGTMDLSSNLTKIKFLKPDVLFTYMVEDTFVTMFKQINELGGWAGIQVFCGNEHANTANVLKQPTAQGAYSLAAYMPGSSDPGVVAYEHAWADRVAEDPGFAKKYIPAQLNVYAYYWNCFIIAIQAIKVAGSDDPAKVAEALRSGKVEADTAFGHMHIQTDGSAGVKDHIVQITDGKLVVVQ
jgi:ABC-type branched-subunit amino acid transport system substrate-binding protein